MLGGESKLKPKEKRETFKFFTSSAFKLYLDVNKKFHIILVKQKTALHKRL